MKKLELQIEKYGLVTLNAHEHTLVNGGDAIEGSYSLGYQIGQFITDLFSGEYTTSKMCITLL